MTPIAPHIAAFLRDYLPKQRGASQHTCDTYAYSFKLLFVFASKKLEQRPSEIGLEQIDAPMITAFLESLETDRRNQSASRNVRLAAIKAFFRFLEHRVPAALDQDPMYLRHSFQKDGLSARALSDSRTPAGLVRLT